MISQGFNDADQTAIGSGDVSLELGQGCPSLPALRQQALIAPRRREQKKAALWYSLHQGQAKPARNRAPWLAEEAARQRAQDSARQIGDGLGPQIASELTAFEFLGRDWLDFQLSILTAWPDTSHRTRWLANHPQFTNELAAWLQRSPGRRPADLWPIACQFDAIGQLVEPRDYSQSPSPPPWLGALSEAQLNLWQAARWADTSHQSADFIEKGSSKGGIMSSRTGFTRREILRAAGLAGGALLVPVSIRHFGGSLGRAQYGHSRSSRPLSSVSGCR